MDLRRAWRGPTGSLSAAMAAGFFGLSTTPSCAPTTRADPPALVEVAAHQAAALAATSGSSFTLFESGGSGERIGVDRDGDGVWDGDERDAHSDPADPNSAP